MNYSHFQKQAISYILFSFSYISIINISLYKVSIELNIFLREKRHKKKSLYNSFHYSLEDIATFLHLFRIFEKHFTLRTQIFTLLHHLF